MALPALERNPNNNDISITTNRLVREFNRTDRKAPIIGTDTGTGAAYAIAPVPGVKLYEIGQTFIFQAKNANTTTTPTLAVNGLAAGTITYADGSSLAVGDIPANGWVEVVCTSTAPTFILVSGRSVGTPTSLARTLRVDTTDGPTLNFIPVVAARANKLLSFDSSGQPSVSTLPPSVDPVTATGSTTARFLKDRFAERFNVKDYGAKGDGVTDDTAAIQAAITAAQSAAGITVGPGKQVYFPGGKYIVSATLTVQHDNVCLEGDGCSHSILQRTTDYGDTVYLAPSSLATSVYQVGNHIKNMGFWYNGTPAAAAAHIHYAACTRFEIDGVVVYGHFGGIDLESCNTGISLNNFQGYTDTGGWGALQVGSFLLRFRENASVLGYKPCSEICVSNFDLHGGAKVSGAYYLDKAIQILSADGVFFSNGHCGFAGGDSCIIEPASATAICYSLLFSNVYFDGNFSGGIGFRIINPNAGLIADIQCANCAFTNHTSYGIYLSPGSNSGFHIANSWISDNAGHGLYITGGDNYRIVANSIRNNSRGSTTYTNMIIDSATDISVTGNFFGQNSGSVIQGLAFTGSPARVIVKGNTFLGTSADISGVTNLGALSDVGDNITDKSVVLTAAAALTIPPVGKFFLINGATAPTSLNLLEFGRVVTFEFNAAMTINNSATLQLAGGTFTTASNSTLTLICQGPGGVWLEMSRKA
jgi:hypothetical protein